MTAIMKLKLAALRFTLEQVIEQMANESLEPEDIDFIPAIAALLGYATTPSNN